ncbi:MAG: nucleoside diphosphate kinase regulator [Polyangiaceae bacterium]|nr:nucleoside diphosphate kinase regulator [Polyangiaceae bacterium]
MQNQPQLIVTKPDFSRLRSLLCTLPEAQEVAADDLDQELCRATIVEAPEVPSDVVTMNSRVVYEDLQSGAQREITLVYPREADIANQRVSVLAPIGSALLGLRVGQTIEWPLPNGRNTQIRIVRLVYQPEAAGDFHL